MAQKFLSRTERQEYLKDLGFYNGPINGQWDKATKAAVDKLQKKYFTKQYQDGGKYTEQHTDMLLVNAWRVWKYAPHFQLEEFKCNCDGKYCTGYPGYLSVRLLKNVEKTRCHFNKPMLVTSGMRCKKYNSSLSNSSTRSGHMPDPDTLECTALDSAIPAITKTVAGRKKVMAFWKTLKDYYYTYAWIPTSLDSRMRNARAMNTSVHMEVRKKS